LNTLRLLPAPSRGGGGSGGTVARNERRAQPNHRPPSPAPPHKGEGWFLVAALLVSSPAFAQAPPDVHASAPTSVALTVYRDDLALVTETRRVTLPGGPARVVFDGVLDRAIPQSAVVRGLDRERERNFDFDGLTPTSLLWRSLGRVVDVVRQNPGTGVETRESATVAAAGDGVMLRYADRVEALGCSGLPERLVFSEIPEGLAARPALSAIVGDAPAGGREITLSYLATGIAWETDYVLTLDESGEKGALNAWITLTNDGEEGIVDAKLGVVAGELSRDWSASSRQSFYRYASRQCWPTGTTTDFPAIKVYAGIPPPPPPPPAPAMMAADAMAREEIIVTAARIPAREELADYQLYSLGERTGVMARQTKQLMLLSKPAVTLQRLHAFSVTSIEEGDDAVQPTQTLYRTMNEETEGLGEPLPKGTARIFAPLKIGDQDLGVQYAGEAQTYDTAVGLEWELRAGESSDVTVRPTLLARTERTRGDRTRRQDDLLLEIANASDEPRTVEIVQQVMGDSQRISRASARHVMRKGAPTWTVEVAPHSRTTLGWRVAYIE
jgi:hypothetical protein